MFKQILHIIVLAFLLLGVKETSAQMAMPDHVCIGTTKKYSVNNPSVPSTYTWKIDGVTQPTTTNEITITWNMVGQFLITVQERSEDGCEGEIKSGIVYVYPNVATNEQIMICETQLPYTWNGKTLTGTGTTTAILKTVNGCDSVVTLTLNVNPVARGSQNATVCANQLPYTWNGQTINAAGTYTANLTSISGCDSIATLNLTVNPAVTSTTNTTICNNELPYTWNGQTINAAGTYTASLTAASGCDSIATLNLIVNLAITSTTNTTICTNQLPYNWNGQTINVSGTYTANLTAASGCDSIATLNLIVNPTVTSNTNTNICTNQLPYTWNGQSINAAGTYTASLTAASGCDSIATLILTVNPAVTSTTNTEICNNQLPYTWNGQSINAAGTYTANLTAASGCDSIATLILTVNPAVTSTTNIEICNNQLPYTWNGQTINAAGIYAANLIAASGCDSIATLNLIVNSAVTSTTDTAICTNQLPYTWNGQTINTTGTYTANLTAASGCDSIATLILTVNPAATSTTNIEICNNQLPYTWNGQTINATGTYTANLTAASGCDSIATLILTVNPAVTSTTNTEICNNQLPYTWNGQTINAAGTYTVNLTAASGCDSIATLILTVNPAATSTTNIEICNNQLPYTWNGQTINATGTYTANLTAASGCDSIATLNLIVNPTVTSNTNTNICTNQLPYTWNGQTINVAGTFTTNLTAASGCDSIAILNLTVNPVATSTTNSAICNNQLPYTWNGQTINAAGTYTASLTAASGCDSIANLNLIVNLAVTGTTNTTICTNQLPYTWNGQTINVGGTYIANLTAASGCDSIATLILTVNPAVTSTTNTSICNNELPYTWNGQTINAAGTYTASLTAASGCDSIATLNLTINPAVTSTTNSEICNNQLPYTWNGQTINATGTYTANLTAASGCDSIATLILTVNPAVTSTTNTSICNNELPYTWNSQTINATGTYTANLTAASGCDSIATLILTVNPAVTSTTNTEICNNQLPYTWNGQSINAAGTYTANLTAASGCDSIATLNLIFNLAVTSTTNTNICTNQLPYTWNGQTINAAGTYRANLTAASGCDSIATLNLTVNPAATSTTNTEICTNQLPYTWNGQTINVAGTFTTNLTAASGCDSIAILNLTVNPVATSTTNSAICNNQLPYTWNGQTINEAGTYTASLTAASGCDSIANLNLIVNLAVTGTTNTTICTNQLPYTWNGQTINVGGTYTANLTAASGCDSIATLILTVNPAVTSNTNTNICTNQLPYTWNGQTINAAGTYTASLTAASGCDSIATLNLTINPAVTSTTNTEICNNQLPYTWNSQTINATGTYTANLTAASGCDSIATLNLIVNPAVTSTTNTEICNNELPYTWNGQSINAAGTYTASLTAANGCDSIATLNLTINPAVTSTTNTEICNNQLPYTWNGQSINAAGTYTANLTAASGCDSIATLILTVNPAVTSTTNSEICNNQLPYTWNRQTINAAGTYTTNLIAASGCDSIATLVLTVNPTLTSTTNTAICTTQLPYTWNGQTINAAGTYRANLTAASGCDSIATLNLTVNPAATSTTNTEICNNQLPYTWNGQTINAAGTYTASLTAASGCDSIATLNLIVNLAVTSTTNTNICTNQLPYTWNGQTINAAGTYTASLTAASGCDSIATLNLTVNPAATSTTNIEICNNQLLYTWNGQTINATGTYTANLTAASGCDSIATLNLIVNLAITSTTNTTICTNQLPYNWNGQTINVSGTYTANLTAASGCDSIATLVLTVNPTLTSTTNTAICTTQLPYTWNGQTMNAAGIYTANLIAASGCDSIATLNLTINPAVTSTTNSEICNNELPYTWNGQSINAAGTYTASLTAASGCDSIATLILTVNPVVTSTTNSEICNNQLPYTWNRQTINAAGTYTANLIAASGCDSIATLVLTVNPTLTSTTNTAICTNQLPYTWNGQTINAAGTYTANLTAASGCDSIATLILTVNPAVTSTTNTSICNNELPYTWNGQSINAAGTYTASLVAASGCDSIATLILTVNPAVTSNTNTNICTNQLPYTWNEQTIVAAGTYTVNLVAASGCDSIATLVLTVGPTLTSTTNTAICTNQLPYTWNDQTINSTGTYTANLTAASGCDSIATLILTVNPAVTSTTNSEICNNQLPYTWNGQSINAAGTYTANLTAASGCDSIATLNLTVNPAATSTTNIEICNNQLPYTWNGQTINATGTYTANLTAASGCDSIATLILTVNPAVTSNTNTNICTNQLPYTWNGQTINAAGTYTASLTAASGCDSIATLILTVNPAVTSTTNTTICTNQLPYIWNGQTRNAAGIYTANLIAASGCDSIATLNLIVNPTVTSNTNTNICTNQLPYTWNGQSINAAGTYTASLTAASGCDSIATLNLTVNPAATSTTNTEICNNQLPYTWNGQSINAAGTYTANLTAASGCDSIATLNLIVNPAVTSTTNTNICTNQLPYIWNGQTMNAAGIYTANLTAASGCDSIATLILTVNPAVTSATNTEICNNQLPYTWNGQTINAGGTYTANLTSASGCDSIATLVLTVSPTLSNTTNTTICTNQLPYTWNGQTMNAAGIYTANLIAASGCDSIATLNLIVNPAVTSTTNTAICTNQLPYTWNGQTINAAGTYTANLIAASGCDSIATLVLTVGPTLTSTTNTAICTNQLPYTWNGQTINAAGTYTASLTAASGCDSIANLNLIVNLAVTGTTNTTICTNQLPYTWNGQTINVGGTYTSNLTAASGCDSIATLILTVNPAVTSTTNTEICNNQLPYTWNGQNINAAGTYTANLTEASGCDSIATLVLTVNQTLTSTTNAAICTNQLPYTWNGQTIVAAGTYTVNLVAASGCDSIATLILTVNPAVTSNTNTNICTNQLPYTWNEQTIVAAGTYTVNLVAASGCDSIATLVLTVNPTLTSTTNAAICTNQLPYTWNGQTIVAAGTYTVNLVAASGCDSIATLILTVNPAVTSNTNTNICTNQLPYTWNEQTIVAAGTYTVNLVAASGCDSIATLVLTVGPTLTSTTNTAICTNQLPYTWNDQTINSTGTYTANLTAASGCDSIATLILTVNPAVTSTTNSEICNNQLPYTWNGQSINAAGTYTANLTAASGCDSIATLNLTVNPAATSTTNIEICNNQLPYTWNGQTINATGTYTANLTAASGCDSIATLNLIVNPAVSSTTNTTICTNQLPYTWNGQTMNAAGIYTANLIAASGCDSIATLNLIVNPAVTSTTNTAICTNQLPYTWNGQTINAAGTYTANLIAASGCDSIATLVLTVGPTLTSTTNTAICTNQLPYTWNGQTINAAGTYTASLTAASGCDSIATLNLTVNPAATSTTNTEICNNQLPYTWNGQTINAAGTYRANLTAASGCDSIATLILTVNPAETSTTNTSICNNELPYTWNGQTINAAGTYIANLTAASGCDSIATLILTVNPAVTSTTNTSICNNELPYTWNGQPIKAAGTYTASLTAASGCDSIATLILTVNPAVTSTTNTEICNNQLPYTWNGQTINAGGTYTANLTSASGCDSIATLVLTVSPTLSNTTNATICTNQLPYTWNGQAINAAGTYTDNLTSISGCDSIATLILIVSPTLTSTTNTAICTNQLPFTWNGQTINAAGTYTANLTAASGCDSIATLVLTVSPTLTSTTNTTICTNQLPYTWNGQTINAAGTYTASLTAASGCDSIATLILTVNPAVTSTTNTTICTNQLPYIWNGQTRNAAGIYTANLIAASGCDSIATLNLIVNPTVTSNTNTNICTNQLPYTWNGQSINAAGTYTASLTAASGCDSIATLNLTVNPAATSTTNTEICNNQLPYTWNGQSINAAGTYTANLTAASGCDSIATLNLIVNPAVTSTTNTNICTNQLPYIWNGQTMNAAGIYTANLTAASGCDSIATLNLIVNLAITSTTNTTICNNELPYTWNGQSINAAGTYTASLTAVSGCDSFATLILTVNPAVTSTTNTTICTNQLPYTWNGQTINAAGTYTANLTAASGCDSIATLNLTINPAVTSTTNTEICNNQLPYTWNGQTINAGGTYTANLTSASGCDSIATLVLTVSLTLSSTTNTAICTNHLPYTWNGQSINAAGTYTANLTAASGCDSIATLNLTINPAVTSTTNTEICNNQLPYTWNGQTINAAGTYTANLIAASGCDSIATLNLTVNSAVTSTTNTAICTNQLPYTWNGQTINAAGIYAANLIAASGCDSIATLNLIVNSAVTSTTNTAICTNQLPYTWNGQTINAAGIYAANLIAASGCDSIATLNLIVNSAVTSTTNTAICTNQLPYTWNGQTINAAGTYTANLTSISGCDSIATLILTVSPTLTSTTNTAICTNQLPFTWNGQTINAAGTYTANLTSISGCDSIATLNLIVNLAVTSTTNTTICTNQLPYIWNGLTINAAGTYTANLTAASGCDSIATLILTVNPAVTSTTNIEICNNQLPYTWNGQTINATGTYTANLIAASGCDSIATLNLIVNSAVTSTTNTAICTNQLPYTWNGQTINAAGIYAANLIAASGCDSIATLNLIVNSAVTSTTNTAICTNQLPYTWNGQTINATGTYTANLTAASGCDSIATLILTVNPAVTSTTNTAICINQLPFTWNGQTINAAGTYTANLTSISGCDSIATLNLIVNLAVTSTTNTTICTNQLPYIWNGLTINAAGTYTANMTAASGCDSIATLILTVNPAVTSATNTEICNNQLPYTWNGQTINAGGTYTANLTSASGCDSIATLILTVNPAVTSTANTEICNNQLPYTWNGQTINAAGTYTANLVAASGCDSIATLILTVSPTLTSTTNTAICTNQLPYTWNGQAINAAGTYTDNLTSISGCDSIATLILIVSPTLTSTTNTAICTNQLPFTWNGQTINAAGTYTANLTSISGCDSIATLNLIVNLAVTSTTNTTICTNQLPYTWNGQTINAAGTYTANLTAASGCDSIATLNLTINPAVTSTTNTEICNNQLPYTWNGQTINAAGTYTASLTAASGCDSITTLILTVSPILTSTTNTSICTNQLPYTWNGTKFTAPGTYRNTLISSAGCDSIITLHLILKPSTSVTENITTCQTSYKLPNGIMATASGTYRSTFNNQHGCDSIIVTSLTLLASPNLVVNNPALVCGQSSLDLTAQVITTGSEPGLSLTYFLDAAAIRPIPDPKTITTAGTYYIKATNTAGCETIKPVTVQFNQMPTASIAGNDVCPGAKAKLTVTFTGRAPFALSYTNGTTSQTRVGITSSTYQFEVSPITNTTYTITSVSDAFCTNNTVNASANINIIQSPPSIRYSEIVAAVNVPTPLKARTFGNNTYSWTPSIGLNKSDIMNPVFNYGQRMDYLIYITDASGCLIVDTQTVKVIARTQVNEPPNLWVPTAWSPHNKDGHNDHLYPFTVNIVELRYFRVFNRWGELVFETKELGKGWDGIYKGVQQVMDTYTWTVEAVGNDGTVFKKAGNAMLLR